MSATLEKQILHETAIAFPPFPYAGAEAPPPLAPVHIGTFPNPQSPIPHSQSIIPPELELIIDTGALVAILIPRPLNQAQLLIAEFLVRPHWRLRIDLTEVWKQWRVYATPFWHAVPEATKPQKPTGQKLFFS